MREGRIKAESRGRAAKTNQRHQRERERGDEGKEQERKRSKRSEKGAKIDEGIQWENGVKEKHGEKYEAAKTNQLTERWEGKVRERRGGERVNNN